MLFEDSLGSLGRPNIDKKGTLNQQFGNVLNQKLQRWDQESGSCNYQAGFRTFTEKLYISFIYSFIHSFNKYILSTYCVPSTMLGLKRKKPLPS